MEDLPAQVADRLRALTFADRAVAYLYIDDALALIGAGGCLEAYGLGALSLGAPAVELAKGRVADLHFWRDQAGVWVLLLDVTSERGAAQRMQQKAYDMTLLQEREA